MSPQALMDSKKALTRVQVAIIIGVLIVAISALAYYYIFFRSAPFSVRVVPVEIDDSYPGQTCLLLVTISEGGEGRGRGGPVTVSATAPDAWVTIENQPLTAGQVAEVTVVPSDDNANSDLTVTIVGERGGIRATNTSVIRVGEVLGGVHDGEEDPLGELAASIRDKFVPWLAENRPELGITEETEWVGVIIRPHFMVVMYYLFISEEWEMGMTWHVMRPPLDWARIYLRHRFTETTPSHAFELSSYSMEDYQIRAVGLKDAFAESIWR